jgi:SAM-dependent methyltransferase
MNCRLCSNTELRELNGTDQRNYYFCDKCYSVNVHTKEFIDKIQEKEIYLTHNNGIEYDGYVNFLRRAIDPALDFIERDMKGLDYGCGYAPTLSKILESEGYTCEDYDPFFFRNELTGNYDFIFSTEVFEHFFEPNSEIEKLTNLLKDNGYLIAMTERWKNLEEFSDWYYTKDPTHVFFYHTKTFDYICKYYGYKKMFDDGNRVTILRKK